MRVYVASREYNYDDWSTIGVYGTEKAAVVGLRRDKELYVDNRGQGTLVEEYEVEDIWQPIETAPKDCYILGYDPCLKRPFVMIWNIHDKCFAACGSAFDDETPTHWMPIPECP